MAALKHLFGNNLRAFRQRKGMSQEQLAELLGLTSHSISNIERGVHGPRFSTLEKLAGILEVTAAELFLCAERRRQLETECPSLARRWKELPRA